MNLSVFDIPLLKDKIVCYLSRSDIKCCLLVSKEWHSWFIPVHWSELRTKKALKVTEDFHKVLIQHKGHVRSMIGYRILIVANCYQWTFPNIQTIHCQGNSCTPGFEVPVLSFVATLPTLTFLNISLFGSKTSFQGLISTLKSLFQLQRLEFCGFNFSTEWILNIIKTCSHIEHVNLRFELATAHSHLVVDPETNTIAAATLGEIFERTPSLLQYDHETSIKSLSIRLPFVNQEKSILIPLIANSPRLEVLQLCKIGPGTIRELSNEFREGKCPLLKSIHIQPVKGSVTSSMADLLGTIGSFRNEDDSIGYQSRLGSIIFEENLFIEETCLTAIAQNHSKVLTNLFIGSNLLRVDLLMDILGNLPALVNLAAGTWRGSRANQDVYLDQIFTTQWTCLGLRSLKLILDLGHSEEFIDTVEDPNWKGSIPDRLYAHIFGQIARLKSLRQLQLDTQGMDLLVLEKGYLSHLSNLKELRELSLKGVGKFRMGMDEAIWVGENWPRLVAFSVTTGGRDVGGFTKPLLLVRPWIEIQQVDTHKERIE